MLWSWREFGKLLAQLLNILHQSLCKAGSVFETTPPFNHGALLSVRGGGSAVTGVLITDIYLEPLGDGH
jgi:hypothetical protein